MKSEKLEVKARKMEKREEEDWIKGLRIKGIKTTWN